MSEFRFPKMRPSVYGDTVVGNTNPTKLADCSVTGLSVSQAIPHMRGMSPEWLAEFTKARASWSERHYGEDIENRNPELSIFSVSKHTGGRPRISHTNAGSVQPGVHQPLGILGMMKTPSTLSTDCSITSKKWRVQGFPDGKKRVFDPGVFWLNLHDAFAGSVGYSVVLRHGPSITQYDWGHARHPLVDSNPRLFGDDRIQLGSCEKIFTAIVTARILCEKKIDPKSAIGQYLPTDNGPVPFTARSMKPSPSIANLTWLQLLTMSSGLIRYRRVKDPVFLSAGINQDIYGYRYLQQDVSQPTTLDYSSADISTIRYPLYHLSGNAKLNGPLKNLTSAQYLAFLKDYSTKVGVFMASRISKYILEPLGMQFRSGWGYPYGLYKSGNYDPQKDVPHQYPLYYASMFLTKLARGVNPYLFDRREAAGYGAFNAKPLDFLRIIARLADGDLVSGGWKDFFTTVGGYENYACCLRVSKDTMDGEYYFHDGAEWIQNQTWNYGQNYNNAGTHACWMIYPYADVQAVTVTNTFPVYEKMNGVDPITKKDMATEVNFTSRLMYSYKWGWDKFLPWIPEIVQ